MRVEWHTVGEACAPAYIKSFLSCSVRSKSLYPLCLSGWNWVDCLLGGGILSKAPRCIDPFHVVLVPQTLSIRCAERLGLRPAGRAKVSPGASRAGLQKVSLLRTNRQRRLNTFAMLYSKTRSICLKTSRPNCTSSPKPIRNSIGSTSSRKICA